MTRRSDSAPRRPAQGFYSPLRYPGGKARLAKYIANLIRAQNPRPLHYAEPFAGGAGAAMRLLVDDTVETIRINDLDPGVAAFWRAVFNHTEQLAHKVMSCTVSVNAWRRHRKIYSAPAGHDDVTLGFATFFLNRCNRSGILTARPIGGLDQAGRWKMDARFNRADLANRIRYLGEFRHRVKITQLDARQFLRTLEPVADSTLVYVDPPYIVQGDQLYLDSLEYPDHLELAAQLRSSRLRWWMTYDCDERVIDELYPDLRCASFNIKHTAQHQHIGTEYAIYSDHLIVPSLDILPRDEAEWVVV